MAKKVSGKKAPKAAGSGPKLKFGSPEWRAKYLKKGKKRASK